MGEGPHVRGSSERSVCSFVQAARRLPCTFWSLHLEAAPPGAFFFRKEDGTRAIGG